MQTETNKTILVNFDFRPLQFVRVVAFSLGYSGRVTQCLWRPCGRLIYEVEYAANGELKRGEFAGDEIEAVG